MSLSDKLLGLLDGRRGDAYSGAVLARRLKVSRTAVWKQIQRLRGIGFPVESKGRLGYRLTAPVDKSLLQFRAPAPVVPHYYLSTPSTQMLAKAGAAAGLPEGHLWIAETQTKGRGRLERSWESGYGGLWFSLLLRPKLPPGRVTPLTLVAGLALRQAVEDSTGVRAKLKWPNDLMVASPRAGAAPLPMGEGYKKLAGILTEMSGQMERTEWVAVGAGLNVTNALSPDLSRRACSLLDVTGKVCPRARLLAAFLGNFDKAYRRFAVEGFGPFRKAYWKHYLAPDLPVRLKTAGGLVSGIARGVDDAGGIMIEFRRKISVFTEGEII